ncbi:MAG: L,D-transpeptidase [Mariprofundaceae bacterium]
MITISISKQMLFHRRKTGVCYSYPISSASKGVGNQSGSLQTPMGKHQINKKIGGNHPIMTFFRGRIPMGIYQHGVDDLNLDWILTRILWLEGCETGKNHRGSVDTKKRYIYIHGTHEEEKIGTPASHGCIRMYNEDIMDLFEHVHNHETVYIRK